MAKRLELKCEEIEIEGIKSKFDYVKIIISILNRPGNEGFTTEQIRKNLKISNRLETKEDGDAVKDHIILEDSDWEHLKERLGVFRWSGSTQAIIDLEDAILDAPDCELIAKK